MNRVFLFCVLVSLILTQDSPPLDSIVTVSLSNSSMIDEEKLEKEEQKFIEETVAPKINSWLLEQLKHLQELKDFPEAESIVFELAVGASYEFRWVPHLNKKLLQIMLTTYTQQTGNDLSYISNPDEDQFLVVEARNDLVETFTKVGTVHISKILDVKFEGNNKIVKVTNNHDVDVIVEVSLEGTQLSVNPYVVANNDHFIIPTTKLEAIYQEMKVSDSNRNRMYKWEWGFIEREEHYEEEMLKLTAAELIVILATSFVQMYCIKSLLDNNQIV